jgi:hypothetical protein
MDFPQLQAEALALARAVHRHDARDTSAALAFFYGQMHEYGILTPHAAHLMAFFLPFFGIEEVTYALLYAWDLAAFEGPTHLPEPTPDDEEDEK